MATAVSIAQRVAPQALGRQLFVRCFAFGKAHDHEFAAALAAQRECQFESGPSRVWAINCTQEAKSVVHVVAPRMKASMWTDRPPAYSERRQERAHAMIKEHHEASH